MEHIHIAQPIRQMEVPEEELQEHQEVIILHPIVLGRETVVHKLLVEHVELEVVLIIMEKQELSEKAETRDISIIVHHTILTALEAEDGTVEAQQEIIAVLVELEPLVVDGGSGFVWTSSTASNVPSGYSVPSSYYLQNARTVAGNASIPTQNNSSTMTGNTGNGYARITWLSF